MELTGLVSKKIRFWSFVSMILLVFVHGYNLDIRYLQPWTLPGEHMGITSFTEYFLANGIFRFRIPMLFIISGFLYARNDQKPYAKRISKRLRTLLVPYLLWSAIAILFTYALETIPEGRNLVSGSHILKIDDSRQLLHDYNWYEVLIRWLLIPIPYQLWFIRVLLIYNLAYPTIRWCMVNRVARWIFFTLAIIMWLGTMGFVFFEGEGLLFFALGVWIQKSDYNFNSPAPWFPAFWWGVALISLASLKTILAFKGQVYLGDDLQEVLILLHKLTILTGLISCWYGLDKLVIWSMEKHWFASISSFSFIIYAIHAPLVAILINPALTLLSALPGTHLLVFVFLPLSILFMAVLTGLILRRISPGTYSLLTGGRGL